MIPIITIDGPTCSGKGTIAKLVADQLKWHLLDSGVLYRALAFSAINNKIDLSDENSLMILATKLALKFVFSNNHYQIILDGIDVTTTIRREEYGVAASQISIFPKVRQALLQAQRNFIEPPGLVADGRDMGTVVFPDAMLKIFLTADAKERAERRYKQLQDKQISVSLDDVYRELLERDKRDMEREVAPLKPATDAVIVDTTSKSVDEVVSIIMNLIVGRRLK
jgi:cytidylate kinase